MNQRDFFSMYFEYTSNTEVPAFFHRWSAIAGIGAFLGRGYSLLHGHFPINPNIYTMLIGSPGTRKSTGIKLIKSLLQEANYQTIAPNKTSKEKFLMDLAGMEGDSDSKAVSLDAINLFGEDYAEEDREMFIAADEFNNFIGNGNIEFISLLGELWDHNGLYRYRLKNSKSIAIYNPTITILGGNTPTNLSLAFPPETIGQGFFSRLIFVYGESTGKKIAFPTAPEPEHTRCLVEYLSQIKLNVHGNADLTPTAKKLLEKIYTSYPGVDDVRFESYSNRRFTHLLKLCLIVSAARISRQISEQDVVYANTILAHTEHLMPKALGEFGKAKHSDVVHKVIQVLDSATTVMTIKDIWAHVVHDLEKVTDLAEILKNLTIAEKIQSLHGGFLIKRKQLVEVSDDCVNYELLTREEIGK